MVKILPFKGYRYNLESDAIDAPSSVIAPPYDVINDDLKAALFSRSKFNIARVTKGDELEDVPGNPYRMAAGRFAQWCTAEVLVPEPAPAIYVYEQQFEVKDRHWSRTGFIALLELEPFCTGTGAKGTASTGVAATPPTPSCSGVHQHEETLPKDIQDRLQLLRATHANFGQIFSIYDDPDRVIDGVLEDAKLASEPVMETVDDEDVKHRLWVLTDPEGLATIESVMAGRSVIIADGHHRYKTALAFADENPELAAAKKRMMTFVNMQNEGLIVLPTHRLVNNLDAFDAAKLVAALEERFEVTTYPFAAGDDDAKIDAQAQMFEAMATGFDANEHVFGLYCKSGAYYAIHVPEAAVSTLEGHSEVWSALDVAILHTQILDPLLGITPEKLLEGSHGGGAFVEYVKDIGDAIAASTAKVDDHGYQALFFMNPTRIEEVKAVSMNHETMPQKSTFFYPKVYTGFVVNRIDG